MHFFNFFATNAERNVEPSLVHEVICEKGADDAV